MTQSGPGCRGEDEQHVSTLDQQRNFEIVVDGANTLEDKSNTENLLSEEPPASDKLPSDDQEHVPDGGYGWFVVLGCFICHILFGGFARGDGIFFLQFLKRYGKNAALTAWPCPSPPQSVCVWALWPVQSATNTA